MMPGLGMGPGPGLGTVDMGDSSQQAFATGMLAGAGLRELSQVLGLSKKRQQAKTMGANGAMPAASTMLEGNLGDLDKIMLLARLQQAAQGGPVPGPMMAGAPDPLAMAGPALPAPGIAPPPMAGSLPLGPVPPGLAAGPPLGSVPPGIGSLPATGAPGGALPLHLLLQMLSGAQGMV